MSRPYKPETLIKLAAEADQFAHSHSRNGERRTADLLFRIAKVLRSVTPTPNPKARHDPD